MTSLKALDAQQILTLRPPKGSCFYWKRTPLLEPDTSKIYYVHDPEPAIAERYPLPPVVVNPVPLAFDVLEAIHSNDGKEHNGISFAQLWADEVARILWLGHKPFQITSQYFRGGCIESAHWLRKRPERLLWERVAFNLEGFHLLLFSEHSYRIGAQLTPYLIAALQREGNWPFLQIPDCVLRWEVSRKGK